MQGLALQPRSGVSRDAPVAQPQLPMAAGAAGPPAARPGRVWGGRLAVLPLVCGCPLGTFCGEGFVGGLWRHGLVAGSDQTQAFSFKKKYLFSHWWGFCWVGVLLVFKSWTADLMHIRFLPSFISVCASDLRISCLQEGRNCNVAKALLWIF